MQLIVTFLVSVFAAQACFGWSEGGHHLIAVMAFDRLTEPQQQALVEALRSHPQFAEDFKLTEKVGDEMHWLIGRAAYWPDAARKGPYDRPTWHYQLGATMILGKPSKVPKNPGPCPADADLDSKNLHVAQAIELCRRIWKDKSRPAADRAIALCWLGHLVGDSHQPCHSGSLYSEKLFREGDRGANSIPTKQSKNMHSLWDGLLGPKFDEGDIRRRTLEIQKLALDKPAVDLDPMVWLAESAEYGRTHVYTGEVLNPIKTAEIDGSKLTDIKLSERYLKDAGGVAQKRAAFAAERLAKIWAEGLGE